MTEVTPTLIVIDGKRYELKDQTRSFEGLDDQVVVFPTKATWQEPVVEVGQQVVRRELLAKGLTKIYFQANVWIFAFFVVLLGSVWGVGKAAVYKHIPDYFPDQVGVVGGMVGVSWVASAAFSARSSSVTCWMALGLWTSCWMFMWVISVICLFWMHNVIQRWNTGNTPEETKHF